MVFGVCVFNCECDYGGGIEREWCERVCEVSAGFCLVHLSERFGGWRIGRARRGAVAPLEGVPTCMIED